MFLQTFPKENGSLAACIDMMQARGFHETPTTFLVPHHTRYPYATGCVWWRGGFDNRIVGPHRFGDAVELWRYHDDIGRYEPRFGRSNNR